MLSDDADVNDEAEWLEVEGISIERHVKPGKPPTLQVSYHIVGRGWPVREWLALDSRNAVARRLAEIRWLRLARFPAPDDVDSAFSARHSVRCPARIRVRPSARDRRYLDVLEIDHVGAGRAVA